MKYPTPFKRQIMVVDDDDAVREALVMLLRMEGHTVSSVSSGDEALALFQLGKFDLILTDFAMPFMTGDKLAATIKLLSPHQPLVMLTGFSEKFRGSSKRPMGVDLVVSKPFEIPALRHAIAFADRANSLY